jgi:hypothetical protein
MPTIETEFLEPNGDIHFGYGDESGWFSLCGFNFKPTTLNPYDETEPVREFCYECVRISLVWHAMELQIQRRKENGDIQ